MNEAASTTPSKSLLDLELLDEAASTTPLKLELVAMSSIYAGRKISSIVPATKYGPIVSRIIGTTDVYGAGVYLILFLKLTHLCCLIMA